MARKIHEDALGVAGAETVIGSGVKVVGDLASESDITIDGLLEGSVKTTGDVTIGINARIKGNIEGTNVTISGSLNGNVTASGEASIRETGHVQGDIRAGGLAISSGGIFAGRSIMSLPPVLHDPIDEDPEAQPPDSVEA